MEFFEKLVLLRKARRMTQTEMADLLGVTRQSVYKWEKGDSYPEAMTLLAMREVFGLSIDTLLDPTYMLKLPEGAKPVVIHTDGEEPVASDIRVIYAEREEQKAQVESITAVQAIPTEDVDASLDLAVSAEDGKKKDSADEDGDGNVTDRKRKRGLFSRIFH